MKFGFKLSVILVLLLFSGCRNNFTCDSITGRMKSAFDKGNFSSLVVMADSLRKECPEADSQIERADSIIETANRLLIDFSLSESEIEEKINSRLGKFTEEEKNAWEQKGWLEYKLIDGQKKYFRRSASNLVLLRKFHEQKDLIRKEAEESPEFRLRIKHTSKVLDLSRESSEPVLPVNIEINYTITVHSDVVPDGEIVRCWMPWPRSNHARQGKVELISTSEPEYSISPDTAIHSCLYMQRTARKGQPTIFNISYRYTTSAQHFNLAKLKILPYNSDSELFKKYTSEQLPQINFSPEVRHLADSITGNEKDPVETARKLYRWFKSEIPWTGALEYSVMPDIPGYVIKNRRGDCGMQTLLYLSMLRYKGIPSRWQSGWVVAPSSENIHDWSEIYFEGAGWVPSDVMFELQVSDNEELREFFFSGFDSYRMIVNDGISGNLYPAKRFMRSDLYDFQRGEVEWNGGNLYFDKWDYDIKINYPD